MNITGVSNLIINESNPILSLPSGFPAMFTETSEDTIDVTSNDLELQLTPVNGVMNWKKCKLEARDSELLMNQGDSLHTIRTDSLKVAGIYVVQYDTLRHCLYDSNDVIDSLSVTMVYNPFETGDTLLFYVTESGPVTLTSLMINADDSTLISNNHLIKVIINTDFTEKDTSRLIISNINYTGFRMRGISHLTMTARLSGENQAFHQIDTLKTITVGKPSVFPDNISVYENQFENALFTLNEDSDYVSLYPGRVLSFRVLNPTQAYWRHNDYAITSGYSDGGWNKMSHQPLYNGMDIKYYTIEDDFIPGDSLRAFIFDDLVPANEDTNPIKIGLSTNNNTEFDTLHLLQRPIAKAQFSGQNLVFLKSDSIVSLESLTITDLYDYDSLEVVIPSNLSLTWNSNPVGIPVNVDSMYLHPESGWKTLTLYSNSDKLVLNAITLEVLNPTISYSAPLRILVYGDGRILYNALTDSSITLGAPYINMKSNLILLSDHDEEASVALPQTKISQDPYLLDNSNYRFVRKKNWIYLSLPEGSRDFFTFQNTTNSFNVTYDDTIITENLVLSSTADTIFFRVSVRFDSLMIDSVLLQVSETFPQRFTSPLMIQFGLYDTSSHTSQTLGQAIKAVQIVDMDIRIE
ncbi:MAG: hypothetical protein ACE5D7_10305, partial [Fidelibacterota bacterium]